MIEYTATGAGRPVPNLRLKVRTGSNFDGAVGGPELPDVTTDTNGRYEVTDVTGVFILFFATAPESDYRFLCEQYPVVTALRTIPQYSDLAVVHRTWSGDRLPPGIQIPGTSVHGIVSENVDGTRRPVEGATVTLDSGTQDPPAKTAASGFYMVCSVVGTDQYRTITARKNGYRATTRNLFGGWDYRIDLELIRN